MKSSSKDTVIDTFLLYWYSIFISDGMTHEVPKSCKNLSFIRCFRTVLHVEALSPVTAFGPPCIIMLRISCLTDRKK